MKFNHSGSVYGLGQPARVLVAQKSSIIERNRFIVATNGFERGAPRTTHHIHLVDYDEEDQDRHLTHSVYRPPTTYASNEFIHISANPKKLDLIATVQNDDVVQTLLWDQKRRACVWRLPGADHNGPLVGSCNSEMELVCKINGDNVHKVEWNPSNADQLLSVDHKYITLNQITQGDSDQIGESIMVSSKPCWINSLFDPHSASNLYVSYGCNLGGWDLRCPGDSTFTIPKAHSMTIRSIDVNVNRPFYIASAGDDRACKFWDIRQPSKPLIVLNDRHQHWIWKVSINKIHDLLVLTSGSDARVCLENACSISSSSFAFEDVEKYEKVKDHLVQNKDHYEDSVYSCEWSDSDPWIYACISFDGHLHIDSVPQEEKMTILL